MKNVFTLLLILTFISCLEINESSIDPTIEMELFIAQQLRQEVQLVGKWKVRRKTNSSSTNNGNSKSIFFDCTIDNFEMLDDNRFIIKTVDQNGDYSFIDGYYVTFFESIINDGEIPKIYLFDSTYELTENPIFDEAFGYLNNLRFNSDGADFQYIPGDPDFCLNTAYDYEVEKAQIVDYEGVNIDQNLLFQDWNLSNLIVNINNARINNFQCEIISQNFGDCFLPECNKPKTIQLKLTQYGSYYWKYLDDQGNLVHIDDAYWKFDLANEGDQILSVRYDEETTWDDANLVYIEELSGNKLTLRETKDGIDYAYYFTISDVPFCLQ